MCGNTHVLVCQLRRFLDRNTCFRREGRRGKRIQQREKHYAFHTAHISRESAAYAGSLLKENERNHLRSFTKLKLELKLSRTHQFLALCLLPVVALHVLIQNLLELCHDRLAP